MKSKKISLVSILFVFLVFCYFYFMNLAPDSNVTKDNFFQELAPQGFAFYSKNPRDETFYFESDQKLYMPNFQLDNIFGLHRKGRAQGIELGKIYSEIPTDLWGFCSNDDECTITKDNLVSHKVEKDRNYRSLEKGTYFIYRYEPLSWHFRDFEDSSTIDKKIAKVVLE